MERLNKALLWLAVVALVFGLGVMYLYESSYGLSAFSPIQPGFSISSSGGPVGAFFRVLSSQKLDVMFSLSGLLDDGVVTLAAVVAWVNRRRAWLIALIVLKLLTLAWPSVIITWNYIQLQTTATPPGLPEQQVETLNLIGFSVPLLPVALALVFALVHRRRETAVASEADTDAALGVVRSAL